MEFWYSIRADHNQSCLQVLEGKLQSGGAVLILHEEEQILPPAGVSDFSEYGKEESHALNIIYGIGGSIQDLVNIQVCVHGMI